MKNIFLLGASGSIGTQTIDVIKNYPDQFKLIAFSVGKNVEYARELIHQFDVLAVSVTEEQDAKILQKEFPSLHVFFGESGLQSIATYMPEVKGLLVNAVFGSVSLLPTIEAIKIKRNIGIANKEILVAAGELVTKFAREYGVTLLPIDSEHSAIKQLIDLDHINNVDKIIITASGGSFRDLTREQLKEVTLEDALKHPNWNMGAKITINSATMVNKGLEVMEAHWLFGLEYSQIETLLHKESIIHSLVCMKDGSYLAHMGVPDMRIPIQYALTYPDRFPVHGVKKFELSQVDFSFQKMDYERFPMLKLAFEVGQQGGVMPAVYNAANEAAIDLFLNGNISFVEIEEIILNQVKSVKNILNPTLSDIIEVDNRVKNNVRKQYER